MFRNEKSIKKEVIKELLIKTGWNITKYYSNLENKHYLNHCVEEFPTNEGQADYALFVSGKLLGIIEVKKTLIDPQNVLEQAKRYSKGAENTIGLWNEYKVPFLYSTNGETIYFADVREENYYSR